MIDLADVVGTYGSPAYVYDLDRVDRAAAELRAALPDGAGLYYSLKANPLPAVVEVLRRAGCRAEVSSLGEVEAALVAGVSGADMLYTGPAKTPSELDVALGAGVRLFSAESAEDLRRIGRAARARGTRARCLLRVNAAPTGSSAIRMSGTGAYFGTALSEILADPGAYLSEPAAEPVGLHFFSMSNARDEDSLVTQAIVAVGAAAEVVASTPIPVDILDLGGGFAAPYAAPGERPRYERFGPAVENALDQHFPQWRQGSPVVRFESGRYLVADCGTLVCTVTELRRTPERDYALLDSGINHLGGMAGLGRLMPAVAISEPGAGDEVTTVTLAGPLCTPADVLGREVALDTTRLDRPITIANVGAYGLTASLLGFLSRPAPAEVTIRQGRVVGASQLQLVRKSIQWRFR